MRAYKGLSLDKQYEILRNLVHIKFPNTIKLVIDINGSGEYLHRMFYEAWEYENEETRERKEFPPLILDSDDEALSTLRNAIPMIRGVRANATYNNEMFTYMKVCFESGSLKLLLPAEEVDFEYKDDQISFDEYAVYIETDNLLQELSNIKQFEKSENNSTPFYEKIVKSGKKDRVTSLGYGLNFINEMEQYNRLNVNKTDSSWDDYFYF